MNLNTNNQLSLNTNYQNVNTQFIPTNHNVNLHPQSTQYTTFTPDTNKRAHPYISHHNQNLPSYLPPQPPPTHIQTTTNTIPLHSLPTIPSLPSIPSFPSFHQPLINPNIGGLPTLPSYPSYPPYDPPPNYYHNNNLSSIPNIPNLPHIPSLPSIPSMPSLQNSMRSIPSIPSFSSLQSLHNHQNNSNLHRSPTVRSNLSDLASNSQSQSCSHSHSSDIPYVHINNNILHSTCTVTQSPLPITPLHHSPKPLESTNTCTNTHMQHQNISTQFQIDNAHVHPFPNQQLLGLIDAATIRTMQITDDLANKQNNIQPMIQPMNMINISNINMLNMKEITPKHINEVEQNNNDGEYDGGSVVEGKYDSPKNPWFNEEIARIVKLHRKTIRKYHRSKTKKKELKVTCKELEKKKRKLIKAAKQKYTQDLMRKKEERMQREKEMEEKRRVRVLPQTYIENMREIDASLLPNVEIPQFVTSASKQFFQFCDTYL